MRRTVILVTYLLLLAGLNVASADESDRTALQRLQQSTSAWRADASIDQLDRISTLQSELSECTQPRTDSNSTLITIDGIEFEYTGIDSENGRHCIYMLAPFEGPLSLAEAYDFIDAYVLAPIGTAPISAVRKAQLRDVGEIRFRALRSAIANENYIVPTLGPRLEPTAYSALAGCEGEAIETLKPLAKSTGTGFVFNGSYTWSRVPREGGRYCVLIMQPFERGLSVDEARDFLFATTIVQKNDQDNNDVPRESLLQQSDSGAGTRATSGMPTKLTEAVYPYNLIANIYKS